MRKKDRRAAGVEAGEYIAIRHVDSAEQLAGGAQAPQEHQVPGTRAHVASFFPPQHRDWSTQLESMGLPTGGLGEATILPSDRVLA
jgi:hypothetical protein